MAQAAGIYPTDTAEQIAFKAKLSGASVVFLESETNLAKFTEAAKDLPYLKVCHASWSLCIAYSYGAPSR
jgi:hypothetical protein